MATFGVALSSLLMVLFYETSAVKLTPETVVVPTGRSQIAYSLDTPSPGGTKCYVNFPDGSTLSYLITNKIKPPFDILKTHNLSGPSTEEITATCDDSAIISKTIITVRTFELSDFNLSHTNPLVFNLTQTQEVPFTLHLLDIEMPPIDVILAWTFGDGQVKTEPLTKWTTVHQYQRGAYEGDLTLTLGSDERTIDIIQEVGSIEFSASSYLLTTAESVTFTFSQIVTQSLALPLTLTCMPGSYTLSPSMHTFPDDDYYFPIVTGRNLTFGEYVGLDKPIIVENIIQQGSLTPKLNSANITWPPGNLDFTISLPPGSGRLFFLVCKFQFGDNIDNSTYTINHNLTVSNPIYFRFHYLTLGEHTVNYVCSKQLSKQQGEFKVQVINDCVSNNGIFDRQYSTIKKPLTIYTSDVLDLTSRMVIFCLDKGPIYTWTMFKIINDTEEEYPIAQPGGDGIQFAIGSISPGLYRVNLNVSFSKIPFGHFDESTYLEFRVPPIRAEIAGGTAVVGNFGKHQINALELSYDPLVEIGEEDPNITFSWECWTVQAQSLEELQAIYHNSSEVFYCDNLQVERGILDFDASGLSETQGYVFTVTAEKPDRVSGQYTQLFLVQDGAPKIYVKCLINCELKTAISSDLSIDASCQGCTEYEESELQYEWTMVYVTDNSTNAPANFSEVPGFKENVIYTGENPESLVIRKGFIVTGEKYSVNVRATIPGYSETGIASFFIVTNLPPYGGTCMVNPTTGIATVTRFQVVCSGWMDEGFRNKRNSTADIDEPITFKYLIQKENLTIPLMDGGESTSPEMDLPLFPNYEGEDYTIIVRVYDVLQDYEEVSLPIQLKRPFDSSSEPGAEIVNNLFSNKTGEVNNINGSSSVVKISRSLNSLVSAIQTVPLPYDPLLIDKTGGISQIEPKWSELWEDFNRPRDESTGNAVSEKSSDIMNIINKRKSTLSDLNGQGVTAVAECLTNIMNKPESTSLNTALEGASMTLAATDRLNGILKRRPFPVKEKIDDVVLGMTGMMDKVLDKLTPDLRGQIYDTSIERMRNLVKQTGTGGDNVSPEEGAFLAQKMAITQSLEQNKKKNATRNIMKGMEDSIEKSHDALVKSLVSGQAAKTIKRGKMTLRAQKLKPDDLAKQNIDAGNFTLNLPDANTTGLGRGEVVDIQATVFEKNPFSWGANGSSYEIESPVVTLKLKCPNGTDAPKMPVSLKLKATKPPTFQTFSTTETLKGPYGMHYHTFVLRKAVDSSTVMLSSPNITGNVTAYFRVDKTPKLRHFDYKTGAESVTFRGQQMLKIFVPGKTLKPGTVVVGILFGEEPDTNDPESNSRRRRSVYSNDSITDSLNVTVPSYELVTNTDGCRVWDKEREVWDDQSCTVSPYSTPDETVCDCKDPPGLTFGSSFYAPPNTIDFTTVFEKFDITNASVYGTMIAILLIYFLLVLWARRRDFRDTKKWKVGYLKDNLKEDEYVFLLTVETGIRKNSGTRSNIFFVLSGAKNDTGVRALTDGERHLERASVMNFVLTSDVDLKDLLYLRIWHDNSGKEQRSWLFNKMIVEDLQTRKRSVFVCNRWLCADRDDGLIDRIVPVAGNADMKISRLFSEHARNNVTDSHLWVSVFLRPNKSNFTRVQRISCCLSLLFLTMITSAMFFRSSNENTDEETVKSEIVLGPLRFSAYIIFVSFVSLAITIPPSLLIVYIFRSSRPKPRKLNQEKLPGEHKVEDTKELEGKTKTADSHAFDILEAIDQEKPLPHACVYIAWILIFLAVTVSAFFLLLYSMSWGKSVSEEFVTSFFLSFFENILLSDPVKIAAIALVLSILFKNPYGKQANINIEAVKSEVEKHSSEVAGEEFNYPSPIPEHVLSKSRQRQEQESHAYSVLVEIVLYTFFIIALLTIGYGNRDSLSFHFKNHIETRLFTNRFDKIYNRTHFMAYIKDNLFPETFATFHFNHSPLDWRQKLFFSDLVNFRVGPVRIRQIRVTERPVPEPSILYRKKFDGLAGNYSYYWSYSTDHEETRDYCLGWKAKPCSIEEKALSITETFWHYTSSEEAWGLPITGLIDIYSGGGYICDLDINLDASVNMFNQLIEHRWIDRQTRAVFIEFNLYNADANILLVVRLIAEFPEFGGAVKWHHINALRIFQHVSALGILVIICEIIVFLIMIILMVRSIKCIKKEKWSYFKTFWHVIDILSIFITLVGFIIFVFKEVYLNKTLSLFKENPKKYVNFEHIVWFDYGFVVAVAFLLFLTTLSMLRVLGYNKRITIIAAVLKRSAYGLGGIGLLFLIIFVAFVSTGYILFHSQIEQFRTLFDATASLFTYTLGKNHLQEMLTANPEIGPLYFSLFVFFVILVLITMFQAILNTGIKSVRDELSMEDEVFGVMNILQGIYKAVITDWIPDSWYKSPDNTCDSKVVDQEN